jgi:DNA-binding MarR family transcriptional regulator
VGRDRQTLIAEAGQAMHAYQRATDAFDDAVAANLGLNRTDLRCLDWLVDRPRSVGELSRATGLSSAATTTLVDRLEAKGFVRRVRDPDDRRKVLVEMTPEGHERTGTFYGPLVSDGVGLLIDRTEAELEAFRDFLDAARELTERHTARLRDADR